MIDFGGSWVDHLPFIEFVYGRKCCSPIGWLKVGQTRLFRPDIVHQAI